VTRGARSARDPRLVLECAVVGKLPTMTDRADHTSDPAEVEPTNNSIGEPVDLNKVEQIEEELRDES
jgi:hypothetical protein